MKTLKVKVEGVDRDLWLHPDGGLSLTETPGGLTVERCEGDWAIYCEDLISRSPCLDDAIAQAKIQVQSWTHELAERLQEYGDFLEL